MKESEARVVITFYTTAEAMAMNKAARESGIPGKLISAPRSLSKDCGIAWSSPAEVKEELMRVVADSGIEIAGAHDLT